MLRVLLTAAVLLGYGGALWWLLRRESVAVLLALTAICAVSLALRVVYTGDFPAGYNGDELGKFVGAAQALRSDNLFARDTSGWPVLLNVLFEASLIPVLGATRWAIRSYSHITSVLSTPVAFAALRGFGIGVLPSLASGALIAVLPWSIFYGRVSCGGELIFHELLVVAAVARLGWTGGGWTEVGIGALGLSALLYDYGCGRVILVLPLIAALLAPTWRARLWCVAIAALALVAWLPYVRQDPAWALESFTMHVRSEAYQNPVGTWITGLTGALQVFRLPVAQDAWLTIRHAAVHPPLILALAIVGCLIPSRVSLFLLAGLLIGIAPEALTDNPVPSAHRMLMAFPFVALAAGRAFHVVKWRVPQAVAVVGVITFAAVASVQLYFSAEFWPGESRSVFNADITALLETIPVPNPMRLIVTPQIDPNFAPRTLVDPHYELLAVQNWFPPPQGRVIYAFSPHAAVLRPFYENLVGYNRVSAFGRAFSVTLEQADWSWMHEHGWSYQARCGDIVMRGEIPVLYQLGTTFADLHCSNTPITHVWRGHWNGAETPVRLAFSGMVTVDSPTGRLVEKQGTEASATFTLPRDTDVTVTLVVPGAPFIGLLEVTPSGDRVPVWERVTPAQLDGP